MKKFGSKKILGLKKIWLYKNFRSKKCFGPKIIMGQSWTKTSWGWVAPSSVQLELASFILRPPSMLNNGAEKNLYLGGGGWWVVRLTGNKLDSARLELGPGLSLAMCSHSGSSCSSSSICWGLNLPHPNIYILNYNTLLAKISYYPGYKFVIEISALLLSPPTHSL